MIFGRGALLLVPSAHKEMKFREIRQFSRVPALLRVAETLNPTSDSISCSFHCTDVTIFNKEISQMPYPTPVQMPRAEPHQRTRPVQSPPERAASLEQCNKHKRDKSYGQ